jgi:ribosomal protein S3
MEENSKKRIETIKKKTAEFDKEISKQPTEIMIQSNIFFTQRVNPDILAEKIAQSLNQRFGL